MINSEYERMIKTNKEREARLTSEELSSLRKYERELHNSDMDEVDMELLKEQYLNGNKHEISYEKNRLQKSGVLISLFLYRLLKIEMIFCVGWILMWWNDFRVNWYNIAATLLFAIMIIICSKRNNLSNVRKISEKGTVVVAIVILILIFIAGSILCKSIRFEYYMSKRVYFLVHLFAYMIARVILRMVFEAKKARIGIRY